MILQTKRAIELSNHDFRLIENIERRYKVQITITDAGRVDKEEAEQSYRELYRSAIFKDVKISLAYAIKARYFYYRNVLQMSYKDAILRLCNCDFIRGENTIKQYLMRSDIAISEDDMRKISTKIPLFDWSGNGGNIHDIYIFKTKKERKEARERIIASYYYFYGECLGYFDVDKEYVICYRDFSITPNQLRRIVAEQRDYINELRHLNTTPARLRKMYPCFAWNSAISFNEDGNIPEDCCSVYDSLNVYKMTKYSR